MKRTREESLDYYLEWCKSWYGEDTYITEDYDYMIIHDTHLTVFQVVSCRDDGWLFCGVVCESYVFTWEGIGHE